MVKCNFLLHNNRSNTLIRYAFLCTVTINWFSK